MIESRRVAGHVRRDTSSSTLTHPVDYYAAPREGFIRPEASESRALAGAVGGDFSFSFTEFTETPSPFARRWFCASASCFGSPPSRTPRAAPPPARPARRTAPGTAPCS